MIQIHKGKKKNTDPTLPQLGGRAQSSFGTEPCSAGPNEPQRRDRHDGRDTPRASRHAGTDSFQRSGKHRSKVETTPRLSSNRAIKVDCHTAEVKLSFLLMQVTMPPGSETLPSGSGFCCTSTTTAEEEEDDSSSSSSSSYCDKCVYSGIRVWLLVFVPSVSFNTH